MKRAIAIAAFAVTLSGCADDPSLHGDAQPTVVATDRGSAGASICQPLGSEMVVDASCFDDEWPFTVASGTLSCDNDAVLFSAVGTTYGVNGVSTSQGNPEIDPIWRDNPEMEGTKVSVGSVISAGLELCES